MIKLGRQLFTYERGRRVLLFIFCLFLAFIIWSVHKLSEEYNYFFQYNIILRADTHESSQVNTSINKLTLRGRSSGFYIVRHRFVKDGATISIAPDLKLLRKSEARDNQYYLLISDIRDLITESVGDKVVAEYFSSDTIKFEIKSNSRRYVPVAVRHRISFKDQYMASGELTVTPASVMIFGPSQVVDKIDSLKTKLLHLERIDSPVNGVLALEKIPGVIISPEVLYYTLNVERYVEKSSLFQLKFTNLSNRFFVKPSHTQVRLYCRVPMSLAKDDIFNKVDISVDLSSVNDVGQITIIPNVRGVAPGVLEWRLDTDVVLCEIMYKPQFNN